MLLNAIASDCGHTEVEVQIVTPYLPLAALRSKSISFAERR